MKSNRNRMKTALRALVCAALLGGSAAAAVSEDAGIIGFSTTGPDRYADGTTVLDGEVHALVWTRSGTAPRSARRGRARRVGGVRRSSLWSSHSS